MNKQLWILAGGNGSGKTEFFTKYLKPLGLSFVNADIVANAISKKIDKSISNKAQQIAWDSCLQKIEADETFCFETVFSHESKVALISMAKDRGYTVNLIFIHLSIPQLNVARVIKRVNLGGHFVPQEKIESRIPRTLANVQQAVRIVDYARLVDNSSIDDRFKTVATVKNQIVIEKNEPVPPWAIEILKVL